jgi:acylphosphatase
MILSQYTVFMTELYAIVTGTVQEVRFRDYVQVSANKLCLTGFVRNNRDGSVAVVAHGLPDDLKSFVEYLHEGSLYSKVEGVSVEWRTAVVTYDDFSIVL